MKKQVNILMLSLLLSPTSFADFSDGPVNCGHISGNQEMYGCGGGSDEATNQKYKCLEALNAFEVPKKEDQNSDEFSKPGKIVKGKKIVAVGKPNGEIKLSDGEKDYKIAKQKLIDAIRQKFSGEAAAKEKFKVVVQTPKGKVKLKFKKKPVQGQDSQFDLGGWEKEPMQEGEELADDDVFLALGSQDQDSSNENLASQLNDKVQNFEGKVDEKISELEEAARIKTRDTRRNNALTTSDKREIISQINQDLEEKKAYWRQKKANKEQIKSVARTKCQGQSNLISENVLSGSGGSGVNPSDDRAPASSDR